MNRRLYIVTCLAVLALQASATTWYVRTDGHDGEDGLSWETAQTTIRLGIDNCRAGDTLLVAAGEYYEGIILKDGVTIIGGCTPDEPLPRYRNHKAKSVLDGRRMGTRLVTCESDCRQPTRIEDFVLQNARHNQRGGAAWLRGKVVMRYCVIRGCSGLLCGGVLIKGDLPEASALGARLEDCLIHNCSATGHEWPDAGGVANFDGTVNHCTIANCYGDRYGGIHSESSVYACTMWGNLNEYGFVDPTNYVSDESESGKSRADEGFEDHFFAKPWLSPDNEAADGPHFRDPATFVGVPITEAEEAILLAADYSIGQPTHRIASMPPASPRDYIPANVLSFPCEKEVGGKLYRSADYTVPSFIAFLQNSTAPLVGREQPYCVVATVNGDPKTHMGFCWFTNEGVTRGEVQLLAKANATEADFSHSTLNTQHSTLNSQLSTIPAEATTTVPLHYAISSSGILKAAGIDKNTAFHYVSHKALATNLKPGTDYSYRVGYDGHWSEIARFRTADADQGEFSFIYMTDSHIQNQEYIDAARLCAEAVAKYERNARFCVFPGDFVDTGTDKNSEWEWERWFEEALKPVLMRMPLVPTDGNHDDTPLLNYCYHFNTDTSFNTHTRVRPQFAGINYSFVYGDLQLIAFSMQDFWRGDYDYQAGTSEYLTRDLGGWFRRQVAEHPEAAWRVGLVHKNIFSGSGHQRDKETPLLRATMLPVMKDCKIDLVLQGHDHCYEVIGPVDPDTRRKAEKGTMYFIGATCGAKRYEPMTREEMEEIYPIHRVENYYDLFTRLEQPGAPSYTRVTVSKDHLLLESYRVLPNGRTELFNTVTLNK